MPVNIEVYKKIKAELDAKNVELIAVSKTKPNQDIMDLYELGHREFGENYVQELVDKAAQLPKDIHWHFIGHLQSNKVKMIAPFVHLIHGVDSEKLLQEINKQGLKNNRVIPCLLQMHIASESTKFGFDELSMIELFQSGTIATYANVKIIGLMGMASFTEDQQLLQKEFSLLSKVYKEASILMEAENFNTLSMGMSSDYTLAIEYGSNVVRIGSLLFGSRN